MIRAACFSVVALFVADLPTSVALATADAASTVSWQSAGDSYSSGEGVFGNVGDCAQSQLSYGPLAAAKLRNRWTIEPETFTACTSHLVEDYFNPRDDSGGKASLWQWGRDQGGPERVDIISMSFGGNDIGFGDLLVDCLPLPESWTGYLPTTLTSGLSGCDPSKEEITARIDALLDPPTRDCGASRRGVDIRYDCDLDLGDRFGSIIDFYYDIVTQRLTDRGQLYVVGYPRLFAPVDQWPGWAKIACQGVTQGDTKKLNDLAEHLNLKLREAVDRANWALGGTRIFYVDRLALYENGKHELCGTHTDWLNGVAFDRGEGLGLRKDTSFHPNSDGHQAVADELVSLVTSSFTAPTKLPPEPVATQPPVPTGTAPPPTGSETASFEIGAAFSARCTIAWPTAPARGSTSIQMRTSCSGVPTEEFLFVDIVYDDPDLPVSPLRSTMDVRGEIADIVRSEFGFTVLVVYATSLTIL